MLSFLILISTVLVACGNRASSVVISKIFDATLQANNVIELYNPSTKAIDLDQYSLQFYTNGATEVTTEIQLTGIIEGEAFFAIGSDNQSNSDVLEQFDFIYEEGSLPFNGDDAIVLSYKDEATDIVGNIGSDILFAQDLTLIRLGEIETYVPSTTYDAFGFIKYIPDVFQYMKNDSYGIKTLDDLYEGPQLEDRFKEMTYISEDNENLGGGGAVLTTLYGEPADGDTATFTESEDFPGGSSMRYFYIDTPEVSGGYVQAAPWGYVASKYNKQYLLINDENKEIHVQSIPGIGLDEGYGRYLGLVWINGYLSQFLIVSEGLSSPVTPTYNAYDRILLYKDVPYLTFMLFAEERARQNGWGMYGYPVNPEGERSPDWNYETNTNTTHDPVWTPHLALPWV